MTATDEAADGLRAMIAKGELTPGQQLPAEPELCARLGVSRGSLREAVRSLAALGLLESRHGSGTFISALRPGQMLAGFAATVDVLPLDGLLELFDVRRPLEAQAAALAAARADERVVARLREVQKRLASDLGHEALINAMAARDPAAAAAAATAHLSQTEAWLRRYAPLPDDGPAAG
ncbi:MULTISPECIES: FadR/GntR family transcriptional regulator [unclassified Streptomyces]|uniref:FadR/GntR family transcriptional regulator n=1 Tax=unclassified Streptomyces TaxID=2593676 RepID=UPI00168ADF1E|nr:MULTISPECIES: GntR family transcriptional regulator [unclassified Streptomyces]MBD3003251.1 FadR family transcriptional regulator [Streptomyces sp. 5-10]